MKQAGLIIVVILVVLGLAVVSGAIYVVDEAQQVVITRFGEPRGEPITNPGLHFKAPFLDTANFFEKRFLEWDGDPNQVPTRDKRFIYVDTYARWRITDPLQYFKRLQTERGALQRLSDILDGETRNVVANHDLIEVVRNSNREFVASGEEGGSLGQETVDNINDGRAKLAAEVLAASQQRTSDLGIEILDFRFKRINYVDQVRQEVYNRMISERNRIAEQFRSEGAGEAARINGQKDRELKRITSEAYREAQEIRGKADAEAADIYAAAYNRDPEFYRFLKTMEIYDEAIDKNTVLVLSTDGEFLRYLGKSK
ncbi:membrane protein [Acidobacteria bacterium Mor1]|nr:membrane protein [Acidobacteria bacterium Mor1]